MVGDHYHIVNVEEAGGFVKKMGKSIYAAQDIKKGEEMTAENLVLRAPAVGDPPWRIDDLIGRCAPVFIPRHTPITRAMLYEACEGPEAMFGIIGE